MPEKERFFLSIDEALDAIRFAFAQYSSQSILLSALWPVIFGEGAYVTKDARQQTLWAKKSAKSKLIRASEDDLKRWIIGQLRESPPAPRRLAHICSQIFGTPARACVQSTPNETAGIWIDTDMKDFCCVQCGHCCRALNYRDGCSVADYRSWQALDRIDILQWVGTVRHDRDIIACRIWMEPGTNRYAESCPWLEVVDQSGRTCCTIHDVRPTICRQYPGSRKHARMTGCRGIWT